MIFKLRVSGKVQCRDVFTYFFLLTLLGQSSLSYARFSPSPWNLALSTGVVVGSIKVPNKSGFSNQTIDRQVTIGGVPIIVEAIRDISQTIGISAGASMLLDVPNRQLTQQSIRGSILWHFSGGARRLEKDVQDAPYKIISESSRQISLVISGAHSSYSASSNDLSSKLTGSSLDTSIGLRYRKDRVNERSWATGINLVLFSLPASSERMTYSGVELYYMLLLY